MITIILGAGIYLTLKSRVFQLRKATTILKKTLFNIKKTNGISSYSALLVALAGTIGTGNIVGVSAAIAIGGPGSIFWMWLSAFFGMSLKFYEIILSVMHRKRARNGEYCGGPMYYLSGLLKPLGIFYAILLVVGSFCMGNMAQINSISESLMHVAPRAAVGTVLAIVIALVILGGLKRISAFLDRFVPFMTVIFVAACFIVIIINADKIPGIFSSITASALDFRSILGGGAFLAMKQGFSKSIASNEAGLGTSSIAHAASDCDDPLAAGMWGIIEVFLDTFVICTLSAFVILSANAADTVNINNYGAQSVIACFNDAFNGLGAVVPVSLVFFAFSSVIAWSFYGERGVRYLFGERAVTAYRYLFVLAVIPGALMQYQTIMVVSEVINVILMLPNLFGVLVLSWKVNNIL